MQPAINVGESWGDAGEVFWRRAWLVDALGRQVKDLVLHTCVTDKEPGSEDPPGLLSDKLEIARWSAAGFSAPEPIDDPLLTARFATGKQACLP